MTAEFFESIYKNLQTPVIVCKDDKLRTIVYANPSIKLNYSPMLAVETLKEGFTGNTVGDVLRFESAEQQDNIFEMISAIGSLDDFSISVLNSENERVQASLCANICKYDGERYFILYIFVDIDNGRRFDFRTWFSIFHLASHAENVDNAINQIFEHTGKTLAVSRVYIFEEYSASEHSNTYEWCAKGISPEIQNLQRLSKEAYNYDVIVNEGMYITNDVRKLPNNDRIVLEAQGIKAVAILPLLYAGKPIGYIGFDDCENYRAWSREELEMLSNVSNIIITLIARRNTERNTKDALKTLKTISDSLDSVIYVNDIETHEIVFYNKAFATDLGVTESQLMGKKCWKVVQQNQTGQCPFCPMPNLVDENGNIMKEEYTWEFQNTINHKWYLVRDEIIEWVDGRNVHIETATEITTQKEYSRKMEEYAFKDTLTGANSRMWAYKAMNEMLSHYSGSGMSMVFLDVDGLKHVNDTYGHDAGDDMLVKTVDIISKTIRKSDAICRWGGDEFLLLLQGETVSAESVMQKIERELDKTNKKSDKPYKLAISYGITDFVVREDETLDSIISRADKLMYESKMKKRQELES